MRGGQIGNLLASIESHGLTTSWRCAVRNSRIKEEL
jgi:hypothetical protein